jgi:endonuclease YncB( thermonuclease family)
MRRFTSLWLLAVIAPVPAGAADFPATVVGISDGDTITVLKADKTQIRVRLHGIDAVRRVI